MGHIKKHLSCAVKSKQCWFTFCMTFAAAVAVIALFVNQSTVNASPASSQKTIEQIRESLGDDFYTGIDDGSFESAHSDIPLLQAIEETREDVVELKSGDTLMKILTGYGLPYNEANNIFIAIKKIYDSRQLKVGQKLTITAVWDDAGEKPVHINSIVSQIRVGERFIVDRDEDGVYVAQIEKDELIEEVNVVSGLIDGNLSVSMQNQKIPSRIVANFINIFSYSVDFRRDVKNGDKFEIIYENHITPTGEVVQSGNILYAALTLGRSKIELYRFKDSTGNVDYFCTKGLALKKTLSRKPLAYQNARVTSPFGKRRHPVYRDLRIHWGVDYAAPKNTVIYAAGDGVVQAAKWNGGYGKYVRIRHNSEYSTAYGHLNSFAKGIAPGVRVKQGQVIGYVGTTGTSTGYHLHYEIIRNGKRINPLTVKASAGENLKGKDMAKFNQTVEKLKETHKKLFSEKVASVEQAEKQN